MPDSSAVSSTSAASSERPAAPSAAARVPKSRPANGPMPAAKWMLSSSRAWVTASSFSPTFMEARTRTLRASSARTTGQGS